MKETPISLCERSSVLANLESEIRLDGRNLLELRSFEIQFGKDYGCCTVSLGETRVLAQVTCEVVEPRPSRPNEGKISIAIHLSPMSAPHFEPGRGNEITDELQQVLDRNIKESKCLDVESLCILAEESVWQLKIDVTILNHAGNLGDACNLAAVAAIQHFHRPDVTVEEDGRVTIHTEDDHPFIPTFLKKIPVCLSYGLFTIGNSIVVVADPTEKEERVMSGKLCVGLNPHGEITSLLFPGKVCLQKYQILKIVQSSFIKAKSIADTVTNMVQEELEKRKSSDQLKPIGFVNILKSDQAYLKNILMERVQCIRKLNVDVSSKKDNYRKTVPAVPMEEGEMVSDEEFSEEILSKSLSEIKKGKKKKSRCLKSESSADTLLAEVVSKKDVLKDVTDAAMEEGEAMSDEEFSEEILSKSLSEIKKSKKKKSRRLKSESSADTLLIKSSANNNNFKDVTVAAMEEGEAMSDEEFSEEILSKSLPEIKKTKKKKSKHLKSESATESFLDDDVDKTKTTKLKLAL